MGDLSANFSRHEFRCKCNKCGHDQPAKALVDLLEGIRAECGNRPLTINSACRCPAHNSAVGGASGSRHVAQDAADIKVQGVSPSAVANAAERLLGSRGGIGRYSSFTHVDMRPNGPARWKG